MHHGYRAGSAPSDINERAGPAPHPVDPSELPGVDIPREAEKARPHGTLWEVVETLIMALLIFVAVRSVVLNFRVDGLSMEPTLDSGEMLLVNRSVYFHFDANQLINWLPLVDRDGQHIVYPFHPPQRGDIVVLHPPVDQGKPYIKRVIGLPGERLAIHDGGVYINGQRLKEPYLNGIATSWAGAFGVQEIVIPKGKVFVMGDNRNNSSDSRGFGPISIDEIIGRAWIAYWPTSDAGILRTPEYDR